VTTEFLPVGTGQISMQRLNVSAVVEAFTYSLRHGSLNITYRDDSGAPINVSETIRFLEGDLIVLRSRERHGSDGPCR
jgi:hypothetical protein